MANIYNFLQKTMRNISWMKKKEAGYLMMSHHLLNVLHPHLHGHISETTWTWTFDNFPQKVILMVNIPCWSMFISVFLQFCRLSFLKPSWTKSWRKHSAIETILLIMFLISGVFATIFAFDSDLVSPRSTTANGMSARALESLSLPDRHQKHLIRKQDTMYSSYDVQWTIYIEREGKLFLSR